VPDPFTQVKSDHHVVIGLALVVTGVLGAIGSLLGTLPAMLAALFQPDALVSKGVITQQDAQQIAGEGFSVPLNEIASLPTSATPQPATGG
jgi:hypothetical protein